MLRQVFIVKNNDIVYGRTFGKAINKDEFILIFPKLKEEALFQFGRDTGNFIHFKFRLSYFMDKKFKIFIVFISDLSDSQVEIEEEIMKLKNEFYSLFAEFLESGLDLSLLEVLNPIVDSIHKSMRPKISLIGFSGVGKTTTTQLIKEDTIPMQHVPTITGDKAIIKIGNLEFHLWDFAGQEQFSYLWNSFIKGSDAVLLITDSTLENVEKSKFFLELIREEVPDANAAIIANKQDLPNALKTEEIERIMGLKSYAMVAIDPKNRSKMIRIISDILEISSDHSPLLKPLYERDLLLLDAQRAFENEDYKSALSFFEKIADLCVEIGDDSLGREFFEKAQKLKGMLKVEEVSDTTESIRPTSQEPVVSENSEKPKEPEIQKPPRLHPSPQEAIVSESSEEFKEPKMPVPQHLHPAPQEAIVSESSEEFKEPEIPKPTSLHPPPQESVVYESSEKSIEVKEEYLQAEELSQKENSKKKHNENLST